jgi:hypothetical protein
MSMSKGRSLFEVFQGKDDAPIFIGGDIKPVVFFPTDGMKLSHAAKLFTTVKKRALGEVAKKFRIFQRSDLLATIYVFAPALSAVHASDWAAFRRMQEADFKHDLVRRHYALVEALEEELHRRDVEKAKRENRS